MMIIEFILEVRLQAVPSRQHWSNHDEYRIHIGGHWKSAK